MSTADTHLHPSIKWVASTVTVGWFVAVLQLTGGGPTRECAWAWAIYVTVLPWSVVGLLAIVAWSDFADQHGLDARRKARLERIEAMITQGRSSSDPGSTP